MTAPYTQWLDHAIAEAETGRDQGGIPIGAVLVDPEGQIIARGHNRRVQDKDPTAHAEVICIRNAGRRRDWKKLTLVSTLSPCIMCTGTALLFKIPKVVIGENDTFTGGEELMRWKGVELIHLHDTRCIQLMKTFIAEKPDLWNEDIGA